PPEFDAIILTALAKDPALRFQSADQFRARLESVTQQLRSKTGSSAVAQRGAAWDHPAATRSGGNALPPAPSFAVPSGDALVPSFCAMSTTSLGHRSLAVFGVSTLLIAIAVAALLAVARL